MRSSPKTILGVVIGLFLISPICQAADKMELKNEADRINYSVGYQIGGDFRRQGLALNAEILAQGIRDGLENTTPLMTPEQINATLANLKKKLVAEQQAVAKQAGAAFLAQNAKKEGVVVLPSGVQYKVLREGDGKKPTPKDTVTVKYKVTRADGREIATGFPEDKPRTYPLTKALPSLQEALLLMKEGSVWEIVLPPRRAQGARGEALENAGVLIYVMELVSVNPGQ